MSPSLPTYGIPAKDDNIQGAQLPLVILTDLDDSEKTCLIKQLNSQIKDSETLTVYIWQPPEQILQSIAKQGPFLDSQANIYATAVLASRAGWDGILVADQLTKRQLTENLRVGEYPTVSTVMVSIRTLNIEGQIRVLAKRTAGPAWPPGEWECDFAYEDILSEISSFDPATLERQENPFTEIGLALHDQDRAPLAPETSGTLGWEENTEAEDSHDEPTASIIKSPEDLNVFLLFPTTQEERQTTETALRQAIDAHPKPNPEVGGCDCPGPHPGQVHIIPLESHKATTRRQLIQLSDVYSFASSLLVLKEPIQDVENVEFGVARYVDCGYIFAQVPLKTMLPVKRHNVADGWRHPNFQTDGVEMVAAPELPFYPTGPDWLTTSNAIDWVPAFYLTTKLAPEQDKALRHAFLSRAKDGQPRGPRQRSVSYVRWTKDESRDGNLDDMWEIFWHLYTYQRGYIFGNTPVFFIDQQSGIDQTVIMVHVDLLDISEDNETALEVLKGVPEPYARGFLYIRISAERAHDAFGNLSLGNMGFEEFGDEDQIKKHPRPGWPGYGVLEDEW